MRVVAVGRMASPPFLSDPIHEVPSTVLRLFRRCAFVESLYLQNSKPR